MKEDTERERTRERVIEKEREYGGYRRGGKRRRGGSGVEFDDGEGGRSEAVHRESLQSSEEEHSRAQREVLIFPFFLK